MGIKIGTYHKDILIDEHDLEGEWITHSSKVMHYSALYVDCLFFRDELKRKETYVHSKLYLAIRANPRKFDIDGKPSEPTIKATIEVDKGYRQVTRKLLSANKDLNILIEIKKAFEHRKAALAGVVSLKISGFHSEPRNNVRDFQRKKQSVQDKEHKEQLNNTGRIKKKRKKKKRKV